MKKIKKFFSKNKFLIYNISLIILLLISTALSVANKHFCFISWPNNYNGVIGVSSQIVTGVISFIISIIGIAISLQNESYFGLKVIKLYALRKDSHYSIPLLISISIALCTLNILFYMLDLTLATIGTLVVALIFLFTVVYKEIPLIAKDEKAILNLLKGNLTYCYKENEQATKDLKDAIKYLLYTKNLAQTYESLQDNKDSNYNTFLLMRLLEYQHDLAFELNNITNDGELRKISDSIIENILDVITRQFDFSNEAYREVLKNKHYLTRVLFRVHELPSCQPLMLRKLESIFYSLIGYSKEDKDSTDLISSIIIILVANTVKSGDFSVIKVIRKRLSTFTIMIKDTSLILDVFAIISMQLYYLCNTEPDVPKELKAKIVKFINETGIIEDNTKIISWKELFNTASNKFAVDYDNFIHLSAYNMSELEYWLYSNSARTVVFDIGYMARWFLTHYINSRGIYTFKFDSLCKQYPEIKSHLKRFGERCLDENQNFSPTDEMIRIVDFYNEKTEKFITFKMSEKHNRNFFNFINQLRLEEIKNEAEQAGKINNDDLAKKIKSNIESTMSAEWGYNSSIAINNSPRYFSVLLEKFPDASNFEETIINYCTESVLQDINASILSTKIYKDEGFDNNIKYMLQKALKYSTSIENNPIPHFYIHDQNLKDQFLIKNENLTEIKSKLLANYSFVVENGFSFNCIVDSVEVRELKEEELFEQVNKYQRSDGQYVYEGAFIPQEEITKIVKDKFIVITVIIKHQVNNLEDAIFEIFPYSKEP